MTGGHLHPESADYLLLDETVRDLDGKLGGDMLPLDVVIKDVDLEAMRFMAHVRARRVAAQVPDGHQRLAVAWMDGFTTGVMFQRAKEK
jgi:hypothetical protein